MFAYVKKMAMAAMVGLVALGAAMPAQAQDIGDALEGAAIGGIVGGVASGNDKGAARGAAAGAAIGIIGGAIADDMIMDDIIWGD